MLLGKGESLNWGSGKPSILADACEALIAAIYLDGGFKRAFIFVSERIGAMIDYLSEEELGIDYKTTLQEYTQKSYKLVPKYKVVDESGPDHKRVFHVDVMIRGDKLGTGKGWSKKEAQQQAARVALEKLKA
jgi:ribonuclease-3